MTTYLLTGVAKWAKVRTPDEEYGTYTVDLYPTEDSWNLYNESGLKLKTRESEDGKFLTFRRKDVEYNFAKKEEVTNGPPLVYLKDKDGEYRLWPQGLIGNGSTITVAIDVYKSKKYGKGHRLERVFVDDLVVFTPTEAPAPDQTALPF